MATFILSQLTCNRQSPRLIINQSHIPLTTSHLTRTTRFEHSDTRNGTVSTPYFQPVLGPKGRMVNVPFRPDLISENHRESDLNDGVAAGGETVPAKDTLNPQQFSLWRKDLTGFQNFGRSGLIWGAKTVFDPSYVKNLSGLSLLELLLDPKNLCELCSFIVYLNQQLRGYPKACTDSFWIDVI